MNCTENKCISLHPLRLLLSPREGCKAVFEGKNSKRRVAVDFKTCFHDTFLSISLREDLKSFHLSLRLILKRCGALAIVNFQLQNSQERNSAVFPFSILKSS